MAIVLNNATCAWLSLLAARLRQTKQDQRQDGVIIESGNGKVIFMFMQSTISVPLAFSLVFSLFNKYGYNPFYQM